MSEQNEGLSDGRTPEDRLISYKWALSDDDAQAGEDRAEAIYSAALLRLDDLLDTLGVSDPHERNVVLGRIVPGPYDNYGEGKSFDEWFVQLQLLPVLLLDKGQPPIEAYTPQYLCEVFDTVLPGQTEHGSGCMSDSTEGDACNKASVCPARVTGRIGLRQLGLLVFDLHTYDETTDTADIKRVEENIDVLSYWLKQYGLFSETTLRIVTDEMNKVAKDFFVVIARPQHRRPD